MPPPEKELLLRTDTETLEIQLAPTRYLSDNNM
jgi:hypothetical protein